MGEKFKYIESTCIEGGSWTRSREQTRDFDVDSFDVDTFVLNNHLQNPGLYVVMP